MNQAVGLTPGDLQRVYAKEQCAESFRPVLHVLALSCVGDVGQARYKVKLCDGQSPLVGCPGSVHDPRSPMGHVSYIRRYRGQEHEWQLGSSNLYRLL